jgi:hypothetical protein
MYMQNTQNKTNELNHKYTSKVSAASPSLVMVHKINIYFFSLPFLWEVILTTPEIRGYFGVGLSSVPVA